MKTCERKELWHKSQKLYQKKIGNATFKVNTKKLLANTTKVNTLPIYENFENDCFSYRTTQSI